VVWAADNGANALNGRPNTVVMGIRSRGPQTARRGQANDSLNVDMARRCGEFKAVVLNDIT
jgi:hypothetical protein